MRVTFYGVRGSTAASGRHTVKYGGNTSSVPMRLNLIALKAILDPPFAASTTYDEWVDFGQSNELTTRQNLFFAR